MVSMNSDPVPSFVPHRLLEIAGGDLELFDDMLAEFRENFLTYAAELKQAEGRPEWRDVAHRLKGAAQAVGAEAIAGIAVLAELSAPGDELLLARLEVGRATG